MAQIVGIMGGVRHDVADADADKTFDQATRRWAIPRLAGHEPEADRQAGRITCGMDLVVKPPLDRPMA